MRLAGTSHETISADGDVSVAHMQRYVTNRMIKHAGGTI